MKIMKTHFVFKDDFQPSLSHQLSIGDILTSQSYIIIWQSHDFQAL
jgi:hypothetical protein